MGNARPYSQVVMTTAERSFCLERLTIPEHGKSRGNIEKRKCIYGSKSYEDYSDLDIFHALCAN